MPHYQTRLTRETAASLGMIFTKDLQVRAQLCADCHVGGPGREVGHDLIAAGHPPLKFELAAYSQMLPKHWNDRRERSERPEFEVRLWAAGQIASAEAAVRVLSSRASAARRPQWPDFADFDCFACHHEFTAPSWRQRLIGSQAEQPDVRTAPGVPPMSLWHLAVVERTASTAEAGSPGARLGTELGLLRSLLGSRHVPDQSEARRSTTRVGEAMRAWRNSVAPRALRESFQQHVANADDRQLGRWDAATQAYLALLAFRVADRNAMGQYRLDRDDPIAGELLDVRRGLAFARGYASPRYFHLKDRPPNAAPQRDEVLERLREVARKMSRGQRE